LPGIDSPFDNPQGALNTKPLDKLSQINDVATMQTGLQLRDAVAQHTARLEDFHGDVLSPGRALVKEGNKIIKDAQNKIAAQMFGASAGLINQAAEFGIQPLSAEQFEQLDKTWRPGMLGVPIPGSVSAPRLVCEPRLTLLRQDVYQGNHAQDQEGLHCLHNFHQSRQYHHYRR